MKQLLDDSSDDYRQTSQVDQSPSSSPGDQAYFFSFTSLASSLLSFHPSPDEIMILWRIFVDQVDPVIKMLHTPTMRKGIIEAKDDVTRISKPFEALLFSIYFTSITSMSEEQCLDYPRKNKEVVLSKYRHAVQQSFARAQFLSNHNVTTLQALILYLVRSHP